MTRGSWRIGVDVGGTFADCVALCPDGSRRRIKFLTDGRLRTRAERQDGTLLLAAVPAWAAGALAGMRCRDARGSVAAVAHASAREATCAVEAAGLDGPWVELGGDEEAAVLAARVLTGTPRGAPLPPLEIRIGTTRGTNALLEGRTDAVAAFVDEGLEGLLEIGTQARTGLFDLVARRPPRTAGATWGLPGRRSRDGTALSVFDASRVRAAAREARAQGFAHAAVALLHSPAVPGEERRVAAILREEGFLRVVPSAEVSAEPALLVRALTACVDASLTSSVHGMLARVGSGLPGVRVLAAGSAGGVSEAARHQPKDSLLSGPAMGCAAARAALAAAGIGRAITFDMGGTSTDVARVGEDGIAMRDRSEVNGVSVSAPCIDVHSVAAGGGSICRGTPEGLFVGPGSAGAEPGPACYGRGGPLTVTDVNLLLGRLPERMASLPLDLAAARAAAVREASRAGRPVPEVLRGFLAIANEHMAGAVRAVTALQGHDPRGHALAAFGGAGGQHACAVADALGIREVVVLAHAGFLSGEGALHAPEQHVATARVDGPLGDGSALGAASERARMAAMDALPGATAVRRTATMRAAGQAGTLDVELRPEGAIDAREVHAAFDRRFASVFGRAPRSEEPQVDSVRVIAQARPAPTVHDLPRHAILAPDGMLRPLPPDESVPGPAVLVQEGATACVDPGWRATVDPVGMLRLERTDAARAAGDLPVDVVAARCASVASWMSAILERTARSVNVRDRLDCSCGILDADGFLCANAPNVPVHLGALGACVRAVLAARDVGPGETILANHPAFGGSHLPDVTVLRPIHDASGRRIAFVAARAHHAEIGGMRPGSMPPDARTLEDEGVAIAPYVAARDGTLDEAALRARLAGGRWPSRDPDLNVDDVRAALAALDVGEAGIRAMADALGSDRLAAAFERLLERSAARTRAIAATLPEGGCACMERMDDGTPVSVRVRREGSGMAIDFTGSGPVHRGNLNAPAAVVRSAVLHALRVIAGTREPLDEHRAPLNEGFLRPVRLVLPEGILNPTFPADPAACPPVFAGNTETSQRVVDALLRAFGACACGQGTMNSLVIAGEGFSSYETMGGGAGAAAGAAGCDAIHVHMTNTRITDPEVLERRMPLRVERMQVRAASGGHGAFPGGCGMVRRIRAAAPCEACFEGERRAVAPPGAEGGGPGVPGAQRILRADGSVEELGGTFVASLRPGDAVEIETPGGGGWGARDTVRPR